MSFILGQDTIRGTDATVTCDIDGRVLDLFQVTNFESHATVTLDEVPRIGNRTVGHKVSTITYEGSFTAYYGDPEVRRAFLKYVATGKWPEITITTRNEDKDSASGAQTVIHKHVIFNTMPFSQIDAEQTSMTVDFDFTCDEILVPEEFTNLPGTVLSEG